MSRPVPATIADAVRMTNAQWTACWRLDDLSEGEKHVLQVAQLRLATNLPDEAYEAPSYTRWQRDIEAQRMREALQ